MQKSKKALKRFVGMLLTDHESVARSVGIQSVSGRPCIKNLLPAASEKIPTVCVIENKSPATGIVAAIPESIKWVEPIKKLNFTKRLARVTTDHARIILILF